MVVGGARRPPKKMDDAYRKSSDTKSLKKPFWRQRGKGGDQKENKKGPHSN